MAITWRAEDIRKEVAADLAAIKGDRKRRERDRTLNTWIQGRLKAGDQKAKNEKHPPPSRSGFKSQDDIRKELAADPLVTVDSDPKNWPDWPDPEPSGEDTLKGYLGNVGRGAVSGLGSMASGAATLIGKGTDWLDERLLTQPPLGAAGPPNRSLRRFEPELADLGEWLKGKVEDLPQSETPGFLKDLTMGAGSMLPYVGGALLGGSTAAAAMGSGQHINEQVERRMQPREDAEGNVVAGMSRDEAASPGALAGGIAMGISEVVPIARAFDRAAVISKIFTKGQGSKVLKIAGEIAKGAAEEGIQEGATEIGHQLLNPTEDVDPKAAGYNALIGATLGGGLSGAAGGARTATDAFMNRKKKGFQAKAVETVEKESGRPLPPQGKQAVAESVQETVETEPTVGEEIREAADEITNQSAAELDQVFDESEFSNDPGEMEALGTEIMDSITNVEEDMKGADNEVEIVDPVANAPSQEKEQSSPPQPPSSQESAPPFQETEQPSLPPPPRTPDLVEGTVPDSTPEVKEELAGAIDEMNEALTPEGQEAAAETALDIITEEQGTEPDQMLDPASETIVEQEKPVLPEPPPPEVKEDIEDLKGRSEEVPKPKQEVQDDGETDEGVVGAPEQSGDVRGDRGPDDSHEEPGGVQRTEGRPAGEPQPGEVRVGEKPAEVKPDGATDSGSPGPVSQPVGPSEPTAPKRERYSYKPGDGGVRPRSVPGNILGGLTALAELKKTKAQPTPAQLDSLAGFGGFGSPEMAAVFKEGDDPTGMRGSIKELLTELGGPGAVKSAAKSTINAHYTSLEVARAMWGVAEDLGMDHDNIVEPGAGIGVFAGTIPEALKGVRMTMIENEQVSASIAKLLYPSDAVRFQDLRQFSELETFGGAIGNVPFAKKEAGIDVEFEGARYSLHNGAILKSIKSLRPGGIALLITSRFTMDSKNADARKKMAELADLVGAVRLPQSAFIKDAKTEVVADILVFRRRAFGESYDGVPFETTVDTSVEGKKGDELLFAVNEFFKKHPSAVLGTPSTEGTMYSRDSYTVHESPYEDKPLEDRLRKQLRSQLKDVSYDPVPPSPRLENAPEVKYEDTEVWIDPQVDAPGSLVESPDGSILEIAGYEVDPDIGELKHKPILRKAKIKKAIADKVSRLVKLRRLARKLVLLQSGHASESAWAEVQKELKSAWESFVAEYGPINREQRTYKTGKDGTEKLSIRLPNQPPVFRKSSLASYAMAIETYDHETDEAKAGDLLTKAMVEKVSEPSEARNAMEAAVMSITSSRTGGRISPEYIADLLKITKKQAENELRDKGAAFLDPEEGWLPADRFLSGDVRSRLERAEAAGLEEEVKILKENQPPPSIAEEINAQLGASFVPKQYRDEFLLRETGTRWNASFAANRWVATPTDFPSGGFQDLLVLDKISGRSLGAKKTIEAVLNDSPVTVYDRIVLPDGSESQRLNRELTDQAAHIVEGISARFSGWIRSTYPRQLEKAFDEGVNRINPYKPTDPGEMYRPPGLANTFELRVPQRRALYRQLIQGSMGLFHAMGAGKTITMIAMALENRRMGLAKKPMAVVPLKIFNQFIREAQVAFPKASILFAERLPSVKAREGADSIRDFVAKITAHDWDLVVVTDQQFVNFQLSPEQQESYLQLKIDEALEAKRAAQEEGDRLTVKQQQRLIIKIEQNIKKIIGEGKKSKPGIYFNETGVDMLLVDEAHNYKNLAVSSSIPEANLTGSQRAYDLESKINFIDENLNPGRAVVLSTGTPITNKMAELHTMFRYLNIRGLRELGQDLFENWRRTYATKEDMLETRSNGEVIQKPRLQYQNIKQLQMMLWENGDIVTLDELGEFVKLPKVNRVEMFGEYPQVIWDKAMDWFRGRIYALQGGNPRTLPATGKEDIYATVAADNRVFSVDPRFIDDSLEEHEQATLPQAANFIAKLHRESADREYEGSKRKGAAQIVFIDSMKVNTWLSSFNALDFMIDKMVSAGVKRSEIGNIQDAATNADRERMYQKVRSGEIRVLIGSTAKLGEGVNVQNRLLYETHVTFPYKPSELWQREGRIIRQGNGNDEVTIYRWATKGPTALAVQMIDRKIRTLSGLLSNKPIEVNTMDDIANNEGYNEFMAALLGDANASEIAKLQREASRLGSQKNSTLATIKGARQTVREYDYTKENLTSNQEVLKSLIEKYGSWHKKRDEVPYGSIRDEEYESYGDFITALGKATAGHQYRRFELDGTLSSIDFRLDFSGGMAKMNLFPEGRGVRDKAYSTPRYYENEGENAAVSVFEHARFRLPRMKVSLKESVQKLAELEQEHDIAKKTLQEESWTEEQEQKLAEVRSGLRVAELRLIAARKEVQERMMERMREAEGKGIDDRIGRWFSVGAPAVKVSFAQDLETQEEIQQIVQTIFPDAAPVHFANAIFGSGPALLRSQEARGAPLTPTAEIAGRVDRAKALIEISLSGKFDAIKTAYHEAYHLARMNLTPQEKAALEADYVTEEHEAIGFEEHATLEQGPIRRIFAKIADFFTRLGNLLRGRGYTSGGHIFDLIKQGDVGRREQAEQAGWNDPLYSAPETPDIPDTPTKIGSSQTGHTEMVGDEETVMEWRRSMGKDPAVNNDRIKMKETYDMARSLLSNQEGLAKALAIQGTLPKGKLTSTAASLRWLEWRSRRDAVRIAESLQKDIDNPELMGNFAAAWKLWSQIYDRADAMTGEIGRALHLFRHPVSELKTDSLVSLDTMRAALDRGEKLDPHRIAGIDIEMGDLNEVLDGINADNRKMGMAGGLSDLKSGEIRDWIEAVRSSELAELLTIWRGNREYLMKAIQQLLDANAAANEGEIQRKSLTEFKQKFSYWWYSTIFSSPRTLAKNLWGGALMYFVLAPARELVETALPQKGPFRKALRLDELKAGGWAGDAKAYSKAARAFKATLLTGTYDDPMTWLDAAGSGQDVEEIWGADHWMSSKWNPVKYYPLRMLGATDQFYKILASQRNLRQQAAKLANSRRYRTKLKTDKARRNFIDAYADSPPALGLHVARNYARGITYTEPLKGPARSVASIRSQWLPAILAMPVFRTVWNIARTGARMTPILGLVPTMTGRKEMQTDFRKGKSMAAQRVSEQLVGTAVVMSMWYAVQEGLVTGAGPDDPDEFRVWRRSFQPFSIQIGDRWVSYAEWGDALALPLALGVTVLEALGRGFTTGMADEDVSGMISKLVANLGKVFLERAALQGVSQMVQAIEDPDRQKSMIAGLPAKAIPTLAKWVAGESREEIVAARSLKSQVLKSIPFANQTLPPVIDIYGQPVKRDKITPWSKEGTIDEVRAREYAFEFARLGMAAAKPPRTILDGVELTDREYYLWSLYKGRMRYLAHRVTMSNPRYWKLSDNLRQTLISRNQRVFSGGEKSFAQLMAIKGKDDRILKAWIKNRIMLGDPIMPGEAFSHAPSRSR